MTSETSEKIGRNDPCPCGSGKKYKHCCRTDLNVEEQAPFNMAPDLALDTLIESSIAAALESHRAGNLTEAETIYKKILQIAPHCADALQLLGAIEHQRGHHENAVIFFRQAIASDASAPVFGNLGLALHAMGKFDEAVESYSQALVLEPGFAQAHNNLGNALQALGKNEAAFESYQRALLLQPDYVDAHYNQGYLHQQQGRLKEAAESYNRVLGFNPNYAAAHTNLGNVLKEQGELVLAIESYGKALALDANNAENHINLGKTLRVLGRLDASVESCQKAIKINPHDADAYFNLGFSLQEQGKWDDAIEQYQKAIELQSGHAAALNNLGIAFKELERFGEAINCFQQGLQRETAGVQNDMDAVFQAHGNLGRTFQAQGDYAAAAESYQRALALRPEFADGHNNLGLVFYAQRKMDDAIKSFQTALTLRPDFVLAHCNMGIALMVQGKFDDAFACYQRALHYQPDSVLAHSNMIFAQDLSDRFDVSALQEERSRWDTAHALPLIDKQLPHSNSVEPSRRLRIGYVSADFRMHSASYVFGPMLLQFDASRFDVFAYSNSVENDAQTQRFSSAVTSWKKIAGLSDDAVADMIRQDGIDILVDLSGHSADNRLLVFARKPAPIQITAWGYATSTGLRAIDVFFADPVAVPPEERRFYMEEVRYLPNIVTYLPPGPFPGVNELPGLSGTITFGSFNRIAKISAQTFEVWIKVLQAVPNSKMVLKSGELDGQHIRDRVVGPFIQAGIDPERIVLLGGTTWDEHVRAFNQIDIALDPFPHSGGVTTLESLMMGVPVVTLRWPSITGRLSASILTTLELTDWIAETPQQYVDIAVQKASELSSLANLRKQLRTTFTSSIIGDTKSYINAVEKEYLQLWVEWCADQTPK